MLMWYIRLCHTELRQACRVNIDSDNRCAINIMGYKIFTNFGREIRECVEITGNIAIYELVKLKQEHRLYAVYC